MTRTLRRTFAINVELFVFVPVAVYNGSVFAYIVALLATMFHVCRLNGSRYYRLHASFSESKLTMITIILNVVHANTTKINEMDVHIVFVWF